MLDIIEHFEAGAESAYDRIYVDEQHFSCPGCDKKTKWDDGQPFGESPYAMPICPECLGKEMGWI